MHLGHKESYPPPSPSGQFATRYVQLIKCEVFFQQPVVWSASGAAAIRT